MLFLGGVDMRLVRVYHVVMEVIRMSISDLDVAGTKRQISTCIMMAGFDAKRLAKEMNISYHCAYAWTSGRNLPSLDNLVLISQVIGVPVDELLVLKTE